jgi:hypothetical protein
MTESEWLACADPLRMLESLKAKASERKQFLFAVACCRRVGRLAGDELSRSVVDFTERYAEGGASRSELAAAPVGEEDGDGLPCLWAESAGDASRLAARWAAQEARAAIWGAATGPGREAEEAADAARDAERSCQSALIRCIVGNPFRPATASRACHTPIVVALAQAAYEQRTLPAGTLDPARLAVLADALEEAGCADPDMLGHLRGPGPHVRGCWAVDLLLGKG